MNDNVYIMPSILGDFVYAPMSKYLCKHSKSVLPDDIPSPLFSVGENGQYEHRWGHIIVIPTQICNLGCSYCYAKNAHSKKVVSKDTLMSAYNLFLAQEREKHKSVSFIGGGEPLVAWDVLRWSIEYIEKKKADDETVSYFLTTNATLLDSPKIDFLLRYNVHIELSFDMLREVQNQQRPFLHSTKKSFDSVISCIAILEERSVPYSIRATITPNIVNLMPSMIRSVTSYKMLRKVQLEPVTGNKYHDQLFYDDYIRYFWEARKIGQANRIEVTNSIVSSVENIRDQFCVGEFCITPEGIISGCHRNTAEGDELYAVSRLGNVTDGLKSFEDRVNAFLKIAFIPQRCQSCFARWHCAGFCPTEWLNLSLEETNAKCEFIRENVRRRLFEKYSIEMAESEKL